MLLIPHYRVVKPRPEFARRLILSLAALDLLLHLAVNATTPYGVHRDEFLYMAMGEHLRLFRMDFPPFIAIASIVQRALFGDSLVSIRLLPAIAGSTILVLAALIARELGGDRRAQLLAALPMLASPIFLRSSALFQPVVFDQLWWTLGFLLIARLMHEESARRWIALAITGGLALLTKFTALFFGAGALVAVLFSPLRRSLRTRWPWLALAIAIAIGSPSFTGQLLLHWPVVGQLSDLKSGQLGRIGPFDFLVGQLRWGPGSLLALLGLGWLLRDREWRPLGLAALTPMLLLLLSHGKPYYAGPLHPLLIGAGASAFVAWVDALPSRSWSRALPWSVGVATIAWGVLLFPVSLPVLAPARMAEYSDRLGLTSVNTTNTGEVDRLPQDYADMLGWPEESAAMWRAWSGLSAAEREQAVIIGGNYGQAGAIDFHGRKLGLPPAIASVGTYWLFGPGNKAGDVVLIIGAEPEELNGLFAQCAVLERVPNAWSVREERNVPVVKCSAPRKSLQALWPSLAGRN
ncbi:MAG: putative rane protein [Gemmatimonadetes bacterium]|nr:putative rane protein [Gemmatimonadota bacterium]